MSLDRVLGSAKEEFDTKMLLDPFEKQLDLPPASIEFGDGDRGQEKIVGQENQSFASLGVFESNAAQWRVEVLARVETGKHDGLIADQASAAVDGMRIAALGFEIGFGAGHKETARFVKAMKPLEVDISSVHDVEGAGLGQQTGRER